MLTHAAVAPILSQTDVCPEVREDEDAEASRLQRARIARGLMFGVPISLALWAWMLWLIFA